ncbi:MAG: AAA family ATPase [Elusimicrobiota bacterium]
MIVEKIAMKKGLAVTLALALGLSLPAGAWAQVLDGRVPAISAGAVESAASYAGAMTINAGPSLAAMPLSPSFSALKVGAVPALAAPAVLAAPSAAVAPPAAIDSHPVLALINQIQKAGVSLESSGTRADAAKMEQAARALPEGSSSREQLTRLAATLRAAPAGEGSAPASVAASNLLFDGHKSATGAAAPVAADGLGSLLARLLPSSWANKVSGASAAAQPADPKKFELNANQVRYAPVAAKLPESTNAFAALDNNVVGQDDALKAIRFGLEMKPDHYNLYVAGAAGSGRAMAVRQVLADVAPKLKTPNDLVAATNFEDKDKPVILEFAPGKAAAFKQAIAGFVELLKEKLPEAVNSGETGAKKKEIMARVQAEVAKNQAAFDAKVAEIKLAGKFGVYFHAEPTEDGNTQISIAVTYGGARLTKEEVDQKIASGAFTQAEFDAALAELKTKSGDILADRKALNQANISFYKQVSGVIEKLDEEAVTATVNEYASALADIAAEGPATSAEKELAARAEERNNSVNEDLQALAQERFGKFGVYIQAGMGENGPVVVAVPAIGKYPVNDEIAAKLVEAGKVTKDEYDQAKAQIAQKAAAIQKKAGELSALTVEESKAVQASKPAPTKESLKVRAYVQSLVNYAAKNYEIFMASGEGAEAGPGSKSVAPADFFRVSVLTDNAAAKGAPVVWEENPTYDRLFGAADGNQRTMLIPGVGMMKTDGVGGPTFKTGSYVKANGGFLVLRALDVIKNPGVWPALMNAVRTGEAEIADGGFEGMASMKGDIYHLPAKVKIVLIGSPMIQMLLSEHDDDFGANFQGVAQLQPSIKITEDAVAGFLNFLYHSVANSAGQIMALTQDAIGRVLEHAARLADSNQYFSAQFGALHGLLQEATYAAQKAGRTEVRGEDVDAALKAKTEREDVHYQRMSELYQKNIFRIDTTGSAVGQINGLAVMGTHGVQMRITFVAAPGQPGLVSVDAAAGTAGPSFIKALGNEYSFLIHEFGQKKALKAQYRVSYEQSYGGIDGDSSTSTTLYGILSALSGVPIQQRFAVTGSADQFGNVQPIGGVNEKIEGFFELCKYRGLTGDQGVVIPRTNVSQLQLSPEVSQAIADGKFHIYAVDTIAQGMEILTGVAYKTIREKADARLDEIAKAK